MIGARLKLARLGSGLSLRQLEGRIGGRVTAQAIGKYERNQSMPGSGVLLALGKALDVSLAYLLGDPMVFNAVEFLGKARLSKRDQSRLAARTFHLLERYLFVEELLRLPSREWNKPPGTPYRVLGEAEADRAAHRLRSHWKLGSGPIANLTELLEEQGIKVLPDASPSLSGLIAKVSRAGQRPIPVIIVGGAASLAEQRLTLAQELGQLVTVACGPADASKVQSRFARAFLLPQDAMRSEVGRCRRTLSVHELACLGERFGVPPEVLCHRCKDLLILGAAQHRQLVRQLRRSVCLPAPSQDRRQPEQPSRLRRLTLRALAEQAISLPKAAELLDIPALELDQQLSSPPSAQPAHSAV